MFIACSGVSDKTSQVTDSVVVVPTSEAMPDTFSVDTATTVERPVPPIKNSREAFDYMNTSPDSGLYAAGVMHKIAKHNPAYALKLFKSTFDKFIIVDKGSMHVYLCDRYGREQKRYRMACGRNYGHKNEKGDSRTPEGFFTVENIYDSTDWLFTDDNGKTSKVKGQFGPRFIRLRTPVTTQIGIHGTCAPWSLGARCSHGCIRLSNESILELVDLVEPGMPVIVNPSRRDDGVNEQEGRLDIVRIPLYFDPTRVVPLAVTDTTATTNDTIAPPGDIVPQDSLSAIANDTINATH